MNDVSLLKLKQKTILIGGFMAEEKNWIITTWGIKKWGMTQQKEHRQRHQKDNNRRMAHNRDRQISREKDIKIKSHKGTREKIKTKTNLMTIKRQESWHEKDLKDWKSKQEKTQMRKNDGKVRGKLTPSELDFRCRLLCCCHSPVIFGSAE